MQIIESYFYRYNFEVEKKIFTKEEILIDIELNYKILDSSEKEDEIETGIVLNICIFIKDSNTKEYLGKIDVGLYGLFSFEKNINKKSIQKLIKTEGVSMLYGQLKAYISANTALSQAIPTINLPVINFKIQED